MRYTTTISIMILFFLTGCEQRQADNDDFITVDVTKSYSQKELILQDFMDVEYIPLETTDEFITMAWLHSIGKEFIVVRNRNRNSDGDIFFFDRKSGKGVRKINRQGGGPGEYQFLLSIVLDEDNNEIFVNDRAGKILVYDLSGNFKREFGYVEGYFFGIEMYNFDRDNLIFQSDPSFIVSKQDGSITKEIKFLYEEKVDDMVRGTGVVMGIRNRRLIPHRENSWLVMNTSSDTAFIFMPDYSMIPIIERIPSVQSQRPPVFLFPAVLTDRYWFMQTVKNEWNWDTKTGHERVNLVYDKHEHAIFDCVVYNADYINKQPVLMTSEITFGDNEIALVHKLEAHQLVEAYEKGQLKGKLKEIAATLDEESNPVIMLIKYKK